MNVSDENTMGELKLVMVGFSKYLFSVNYLIKKRMLWYRLWENCGLLIYVSMAQILHNETNLFPISPGFYFSESVENNNLNVREVYWCYK